MMRLAFIVTGLFCVSALAENYAVVDLMRVFSEVEDGISAKKKLEEEFKKKQKILDQKQVELKKLKEDFEKQTSLMNPSAREKKAVELQTKFAEAQKTHVEMQQEMARKEQELTTEIIRKMEPIAAQIAKEKKLNGILRKDAFFYIEPSADVTTEIAAKYNSIHRKSKK